MRDAWIGNKEPGTIGVTTLASPLCLTTSGGSSTWRSLREHAWRGLRERTCKERVQLTFVSTRVSVSRLTLSFLLLVRVACQRAIRTEFAFDVVWWRVLELTRTWTWGAWFRRQRVAVNDLDWFFSVGKISATDGTGEKTFTYNH